MDYKIESGRDIPDLVLQVEAQVREGWEPIGGVASIPHPQHGHMLIQAMTKKH